MISLKKTIIIGIILFINSTLFSFPLSDFPSQSLPIEGNKNVAFDYDLDGDLDLAIIDESGEIAYGFLLENDNGTFIINTFWGFGDAGDGANAIAEGDVDGNGFPDLVMNQKNRKLVVFLNNYGSIDVNNPSWTFTNNSQVEDVLLGDFDNDGKLDLAVANFSNNNWLFKGDGNGKFGTLAADNSPPNLVIPGTNFTLDISAGDLNNDGNLDLACANGLANGTGGLNKLYLLNGFSIITASTNPNSYHSTCVEIGDINKDGFFDLLIGGTLGANRYTNVVYVLTNTGSGTFNFKQTLSRIQIGESGKYIPASLDLADINRDNYPEVVVLWGQDWGSSSYVYTNVQGTLVKVNNFQINAGDVYPNFLDVDSDGDLDLVTALIYENELPVIDTTPALIVTNQKEVNNAFFFNRDNILIQYWDRIVIGRPEIWSGSSQFKTNYSTNIPAGISAAAKGDINGSLTFEDLPDFVIGARNGMIYAFTNTSNGGNDSFELCWSNRVHSHTNGYLMQCAAIGDVNGDGAPDLVYSTQKTNGGGGATDSNQNNYVLLNLSSSPGFFTNATALPPMDFAGTLLYVPASKIMIEDIDKDGDNDIIGFAGGPDWVCYNKGQGVFDEMTSQYPEVASTRGGDLGDVDGDGDLDIARVNSASFTYIYGNNNGVFSASPMWQSPTLERGKAARFMDIDNDGDLDLGVANEELGMYSYIMRNKGTGLGTTANDMIWSTPAGDAVDTGIVLSDFDGDTDIDVFLAGGSDGGTYYPNRAYRGRYSDNYRGTNYLPNTPSYIEQDHSDGGGPTNLANILFNYIGYDHQGDGVNANVLVRFQVSLLDGTSWKDATVSSTGADFTPGPLSSSFYMKTSPGGYTNKTISWNALADAIEGSRFVMRTVVYPSYQKTGKVQHAAFIYYMKADFHINGEPNCFITSPQDGAEVSGTVSLYGAAYDYDFKWYGIFIRDPSNNLVAAYSNNTPVPPVGTLYTWDTAGLPSGLYTVRLVVKDNFYPVKSETITLNLKGVDTSAPTVEVVYPTNNTLGAPANSPVIAGFSRYMNVNTMRDGTMRVFYGQNELSGNLKYKNIVKSLIFDPTDNLAFNSVHVPQIEAAFKDVLGNKLGKNFIWNFSAEKGLPTTIEDHFPKFEDVATNTVIKVTYSVDMSSVTNFNDDNFYIQDLMGNKVSGTCSKFNPTNRTVTFTPYSPLDGSTLYIVTLKKPIISESVPYPYSWYFITQDTVLPKVLSTSPAEGDDFFNPTQTIAVNFNKTMNVNMLQEGIFELKQGDTVINGDLIYDMQNNMLIFQPKSPLDGLAKYTATVFSKFEDMGGISLSSSYTWSFRATRILSAAGGILESSDGSIRLRVPKNALRSDTAISVSKTSNTPAPADPMTRSAKLGFIFEPSGLVFNKAVTVFLTYPDADNNGIVDDPATGADFQPPLYASKLALFYYDKKSGKYERIGGTVDQVNKKVQATVKHFSTFALLEDNNVYDDDLEITEINTYPRVFSPSDDETVDISFNVKLKASGKADVKIYNLAGRLVKEVKTDMDIVSGINLAQWDGKDKDSDKVHNRMYVILISITDESGKTVNKTKTMVVMD
ncbi:MAG: VCBS repeat-containing protein [Spirochaetes bacterium]|nr:VCBS repeat-containing protein [Spirochaetota bacterium]